ncbi:MAG TPA: hypothetical protein VG347_21795 [Verrucomicrobiae bacterium]|nr:hypothetical protein [Verrucomicrobiae bacterium]
MPLGIREQLNQRLADGVPGVELVRWLNGLPKVRRILAREFARREITDGNLSDWKLGGFADWQVQREALANARELAGRSRALNGVVKGHLADHLALVLEAQYAQLLNGWNGDVDETFRQKLKGLQLVGQNLAELRRGDHRAGRLQVHWERLAQEKKKDGLRAYGEVLGQCKRWPQVEDAFRAAFALFEEHQAREDKPWKFEKPAKRIPGKSG